MAAARAACQGVWLARLLSDMVGVQCEAPELQVDNQSAITLGRTPSSMNEASILSFVTTTFASASTRGESLSATRQWKNSLRIC
jgi:hypothetical protein